MTRTRKFLWATAFLTVVLYLVGAFIAASWNSVNWAIEVRVIVAGLWLYALGMSWIFGDLR